MTETGRHLTGHGLHSGRPAAVTLSRCSGPLCFESDGGAVPFEALRVTRADSGVAVQAPGSGLHVDLVEHLLAAFGGLAIRTGARILVQGGEVPLLDGGAATFVASLRALQLGASPPNLRVARPGTIRIDGSDYVFEPASRTTLRVDVDFSHRGLAPETATWHGDPDEFVERIAPARTFGFLDDAPTLAAAGRARGADTASVLVFDGRGRCLSPAPPGRAELARHKLLDLIGDLTLFGGPPLGSLGATRPGHARTHAAIRHALADGILVSER